MLPILIVGGGLAGLAAARECDRSGRPYRLFESSDRVGGKLKTDLVDGYRLDRGFQVFFEAYPHAAAELDYPALKLGHFRNGAKIFADGRWHVIDQALPIQTALSTLFGVRDKLLTLRWKANPGSPEDITAHEFLSRAGFSARYRQRFARPFFGGITLDPNLSISSHQLNFIFKMLSEKGASLPELGIEQIPIQMAAKLDASHVHTNSSVTQVGETAIMLANGEKVEGSAIILAVPGEIVRAFGFSAPVRDQLASYCYWYAAPRAPYSEPYLALNGDADGPINHLAVITNVHSSYGPTPLISATCLQPQRDESAIKLQIDEWFGQGTFLNWRLLRKDVIRHAQPTQPPNVAKASLITKCRRVFLAGEEVTNASIDGAIESGIKAAREAMSV